MYFALRLRPLYMYSCSSDRVICHHVSQCSGRGESPRNPLHVAMFRHPWSCHNILEAILYSGCKTNSLNSQYSKRYISPTQLYSICSPDLLFKTESVHFLSIGPKMIIMLEISLKMCEKATLIHCIFYDKKICFFSPEFLLWTMRLYIHFKLSLLGWRWCTTYALFSAAKINTKCFSESCRALCNTKILTLSSTCLA